jgi:hypothetical protein
MLVAVVTYLVRMRTILRPAAAAVVLVAALSATACTPPPEPPRTPAPSSTPLFASDEEALAAAEAAYAAYVEVTDNIFHDGASDLTELETVAVGRQLINDRSGFEEIAEEGYRSVGNTQFSQTELQQYSPNRGKAVVVVYLCEDVSDVDVFDPAGNSIVQEDRPDRVKYEVTFDAGNSASLLVSDRVPWRDGQCLTG